MRRISLGPFSAAFPKDGGIHPVRRVVRHDIVMALQLRGLWYTYNYTLKSGRRDTPRPQRVTDSQTRTARKQDLKCGELQSG